MANLWLAANNDPRCGGVVVEWPSGMQKLADWQSNVPIADTLAIAKEIAAQLIQERIDSRYMDDVERTNIASLIAAIQKHVTDWNANLVTKMHAGAAARQ